MRKWAMTIGGTTMLLLMSCSLVVDTSGLTGGAVVLDGGNEAGGDVLPVEAPIGAVDAAAIADADAAPEATPAEDAAVDAGPSLPPDLVAAWTFEDDVATVAVDVTGHGHDGAISNGKHVPGKYGQALDLGVMGKMVVAAAPEFDRNANEPFTITAWTKLGSSPSHSFLFSVDYQQSAFGLEIRDASHVNYFQGDGFTDGHIATSLVSFGAEWCHLALVVAGASVKLYFNGTLAGIGTGDTTPRHASQVTIGTSNSGEHLNAAVDDIRFYARALSEAEIRLDRDLAR